MADKDLRNLDKNLKALVELKRQQDSKKSLDALLDRHNVGKGGKR
jgi:hypothetical protein